MQNVSLAFKNAMREQPYIARITPEGAAPIQGDPITNIIFTGGANDKGDKITIGSTVAAMVEIQMEKDQGGVAFKGRELTVELGLDLPGGIEWMLMGTYKVTDVQKDDDSITVKAMDYMAAVLDVEYEPIPGFDFTDEKGVSSVEFLSALCGRRGVQVDLSNIHDLPLCNLSPEGYTERQIIGMLAALYGTFAVFDRTGTLHFRWYTEVDAKVTGDEYYESGMEIADYDFSVQWLKCYVEAMEETLTLGDAGAEQGIYFECQWMTEEQLQVVWEKIRDFSYRPVKELSFFGDPRLDPGDIIALEDCGGGTYSVPVMAISHDYDGGIITDVSAGGQATTDAYEGPVKRDANRTYAQILKKVKEIDLSIRSVDGNKIIALINLSDEGAKIAAENIKLEGIVTANKNFKILLDGSVEAAAGKIGGCEIKDGKLEVPAAHIKGTLTIGQLPENVAQKGDIPSVPTKLSAFKNDCSYQTESGVVSIINGNVTADYISALRVTAAKLLVKDSSGSTLLSAGDNKVQLAGWTVDDNSIRHGNLGANGSMWLCRTGTSVSPATYSNGGIGGAPANQTGWCITVGNKFGVLNSGALYATEGAIGGCQLKNGILHLENANADNIIAKNATISGHVEANTGKIGGWNIGTKAVMQSTSILYSGPAIYSDECHVGGYSVWTTLTPSKVYVEWFDGIDSDVYSASWLDILRVVSNSK